MAVATEEEQGFYIPYPLILGRGGDLCFDSIYSSNRLRGWLVTYNNEFSFINTAPRVIE